VTEWQLFEPGTVPEHVTAAWYRDRESAPHVDQPEHHGRLLLACDLAEDAVLHHDCRSIVDLGCGDGGLLTLLAERLSDEATMGNDVPLWGYDLAPANVRAARERRGLDTVSCLDVVSDPNAVTWGELAIVTEMLEHLLDPHAFVRAIARRSRFLVASSPYVETDRSHYDFHTWAWDEAGYDALLEQGGFQVIQRERWSIFQVVLAARVDAT
jgi:hypothetical protein